MKPEDKIHQEIENTIESIADLKNVSEYNKGRLYALAECYYFVTGKVNRYGSTIEQIANFDLVG